MSFLFPSGLTLYMFTNSLLTALQSIYMSKSTRREGDRGELAAKQAEQAAKDAARQGEGRRLRRRPKATVVKDRADDRARRRGGRCERRREAAARAQRTKQEGPALGYGGNSDGASDREDLAEKASDFLLGVLERMGISRISTSRTTRTRRCSRSRPGIPSW